MKYLKVFPKNQSGYNELMNLLSDLTRKIRLASLRGATTEEMQN